MQRLYLSDAQVTDTGLALLKGLTRLQDLSLSGCTDVTDAGLAQLKGLTALRYLVLDRTHVTDPGVAKFEKAVPACRISHRDTHP